MATESGPETGDPSAATNPTDGVREAMRSRLMMETSPRACARMPGVRGSVQATPLLLLAGPPRASPGDREGASIQVASFLDACRAARAGADR